MLFNRYPDGGKTGVRLDMEEHPSWGRALDLGRASGGIRGPFSLWVRQHDGVMATLDGLEADDLAALRDGINSLLAAEGLERKFTINVPVNAVRVPQHQRGDHVIREHVRRMPS